MASVRIYTEEKLTVLKEELGTRVKLLKNPS